MVKKLPEFGIVLRSLYLARHIGPFKILNSLDDTIEILLFFEIDLLLRCEVQYLGEIFIHFCNILIINKIRNIVEYLN